MTSFLAVLGHRDAISWVLKHRQMALGARARGDSAGLAQGDEIFLYSSRKAWNKPNRDQGRVFGRCELASPFRQLEKPLEIGGRTFWYACDIKIVGLTQYPEGIDLRPLTNSMKAFPRPEAWSSYMQRSLLKLPEVDADLLRNHLASILYPPSKAVPSYTEALLGS